MTRTFFALALPLTLAVSIALPSAPSSAAEPDPAPTTMTETSTTEATTAPSAPTDTPTPPPPAPALDPAEQVELDRVLGHARRLRITGTVFTAIGLGAALSSGIVGAQNNLGLAIGLSAKALVTTSIGGILLVAGKRRLRNPQKFMRTRKLAMGLGPQLSPHVRGATFSLRF